MRGGRVGQEGTISHSFVGGMGPWDPAIVFPVNIYAPDGLTIIATFTPERVMTGLYQIHATPIPGLNEPGIYFDEWTYQDPPADPVVSRETFEILPQEVNVSTGAYRGRLIFPFLADIYRMDFAKTAEPVGSLLPSGFDTDFRETVPVPQVGQQVGPSSRKEKAVVRLPCQVEPDSWEALQEYLSGNVPRSEVTLIFHFRDLENRGLVDVNGRALIQVDDRLGGLYRTNGTLVQNVPNPPGLFVKEARPIGLGLNGNEPHRNLLLVAFSDREQGTRT